MCPENLRNLILGKRLPVATCGRFASLPQARQRTDLTSLAQDVTWRAIPDTDM